MALESLSDDAVLSGLDDLLRQSRRVESSLVAHLAEVEARRLYARYASPSMFVYCRDVLHLSEGEAQLRLTVARAAREHPILLTMLAEGRLHLSGIARLAPVLTPENLDALLSRAVHRSKREIEELVAELAPRPDVPSGIRKLPVRVADPIVPDPVVPDPVVPHRVVPDPVAPDAIRGEVDTPRPAAALRPAPPSLPVFQTLSPARYKVQFTAGPEMRDDLEALKALMRSEVPDGDLAVIVGMAVRQMRQRLEARRFAQTSSPRKERPGAGTSSRYIPAAVRRAVYRRDGGRCRFVDAQGRRCPERHRLDYHHRHPYGLGGSHDLDNICLMCSLCRYRHKGHYAGFRIMPRKAEDPLGVRRSWGFEVPLVGIILPVPRFPFRSVNREEEAWMRYGSGSLDL